MLDIMCCWLLAACIYIILGMGDDCVWGRRTMNAREVIQQDKTRGGEKKKLCHRFWCVCEGTNTARRHILCIRWKCYIEYSAMEDNRRSDKWHLKIYCFANFTFAFCSNGNYWFCMPAHALAAGSLLFLRFTIDEVHSYDLQIGRILLIDNANFQS